MAATAATAAKRKEIMEAATGGESKALVEIEERARQRKKNRRSKLGSERRSRRGRHQRREASTRHSTIEWRT